MSVDSDCQFASSSEHLLMGQVKPDDVEPCQLCGTIGKLQNSHIIPAFVFRDLKERSGTGHIRFTENPNRRVQDGNTVRMLCSACEAMFSEWERAFANKIYRTWPTNGSVRYGDWLLKFCVSVSWRVLKYCKGINHDNVYTEFQEAALARAADTWRDFLLGERKNPRECSQHLLFFDVVSSTNVESLPHNFNRFMCGAVTMDIVGSCERLYTWAKLGNFQIFGAILDDGKQFEGTMVHVNDGLFNPRRVVLPGDLLDFYRKKAVSAARAMDSLSQTQRDKIHKSITRDLDKFSSSRQYRALEADALMFGVEAVIDRREGNQ